MSVVKWSRSAFFATSSGRARARGSAPRRGASASTFSGTMSRAQTSWPSSAKQAAVTRPTQPTPMTPIGSLSMRAGRLSAQQQRLAERAMAIICRLVSVWSSVFEIQYAALGVRQPTSRRRSPAK